MGHSYIAAQITAELCAGVNFCGDGFNQPVARADRRLFGDIGGACEQIAVLSVTFVTMMRFILTIVYAVGIIFLISGERLKSG